MSSQSKKSRSYSRSARFLRRLAKRRHLNSHRLSLYKMGGIRIGNGCFIGMDADLEGDVIFSDSVSVETKAFLREVEVGKGTKIDRGAVCIGVVGRRLIIGEECYIGYHAVLDGSGGLKLGNHVHVSNSVGIWSHSGMLLSLAGSKLRDSTHRKEAEVKIEDSVWIGGGSTVYPGASIGHHSVVLPNSTVTESIEPCSMVGGNPAKLIKKIEVGDEIKFINP